MDTNQISRHDSEKKRAGIDRLATFSNGYEIQTLCKMLNMNRQQLFDEDDSFCTWMLIGNRESTNFEERLFDILNPKK